MVRKTGILAGVLALLIAFISKIPIYPPIDLEINFMMMVKSNTEYYIWGYVVNEIISSSTINLQFPENIIGIFLWSMVIFIGISSIMASIKKAKFKNSLTLYNLNVLFCILIITIYSIIILTITWNAIIEFFYTAALGYYLFIIILILNIIALRFLKKSNLES
ncbi:MAG: hypothetical protein ACQERB_13370 [Promethearchaeati archaeon]